MQGEHQVSLLTAGTEAAQYQEQLRNVGKPAVTFATDDSQATHVSANKRQGSAGMLAKLYQASLARLSFGGKPSVRVDEDDFDESQVGDSSWQSCNTQRYPLSCCGVLVLVVSAQFESAFVPTNGTRGAKATGA